MTDSAVSKSKKTTVKKENKFLKALLRHLMIFVISLGIVAITVTTGFKAVNARYFKPVDIEDSTPVEVEVPMGTSVSGIANILFDKGLIRNVGVFKLMVDISNKANRMQAGKYTLAKDMTIQQMIDELLTGRVSVSTVLVTLKEGEDIRKIAQRLVKDYKLPFTEEEFYKAAKNYNLFVPDFPFLQEIPKERLETEFPLEGYLFPNTYYVFADDTPVNVIRILLREFEKTYTDEMQEQADALGLTTDQVVTLASIIQNEGKTLEFEKISAVFHNRLRISMRLESCATVNYILDKDVSQVNLTLEDIATESPYNTYLIDGLPLGPISSPGKAAIMAALNPLEAFMDEEKPMLFFVLKDPEIGHHAFNSSYQDHVRDKRIYEKLWN